MLQVSNINTAISLAVELDKNNLFLTAIHNTPLETLVSLSKIDTNVIDNSEYIPDSEKISEISKYGDDDHGNELNEITKFHVDCIRKHINFAKNMVKPCIIELESRLRSNYEDMMKEQTIGCNIVVWKLPEPLFNSDLIHDINKYEKNRLGNIDNTLSVSRTITSSEIIELCSTYNSELDEVFINWINTLGESLLIDISKLLFTKYNENTLEERLKDKESGIYYALIIYLITNRIYNNPMENTVSSLSNFNSIVSNIKEYSGIILYNHLYNYRLNINSDLLIKNQYNKTITVISEVYDKYIKQGGTDAALFGNLLSDKKIFMNDICENQIKYIDNWERQNNFLNMSIQSKSFIKKKEALYYATFNLVSNNFDNYFGHLCTPNTLPTLDMKEYVTYLKLLDKTISNLKELDFVNTWTLVTKIVCTCIFHYTDSKKILESVDAAMRLNNVSNSREALLISIIEYVADYVAESICIKG